MINLFLMALLLINMIVGLWGMTFSSSVILCLIWFFGQVFIWMMLCKAYVIGAILFLMMSHLLLSFVFFNRRTENILSLSNRPMRSKDYWRPVAYIVIGGIVCVGVSLQYSVKHYMFSHLFDNIFIGESKIIDIRTVFQESSNFIIVLLILLLFITAMGCLKMLKRKFFHDMNNKR